MFLRYDDAVEHLRKAVEVRGADWVYPDEWRTPYETCQYFLADGSPACIVGQVISQLSDEAPVSNTSLKIVASLAGIEVDADAEALLQRAQNWQDHGATWGESIANAIAAIDYKAS
jgi:hypothetical protein